MKKEMSRESALLDKKRMSKYKFFALSFSYPYGKEDLVAEYDHLFRVKEVWLYGTEHTAKNEFQRAHFLSDIMGFYRAFGVEPQNDRPDSLSSELEFMYYLIFKKLHALKNRHLSPVTRDSKEKKDDAEERALICLEAQKKFFTEHLYPAAKNIAKKIASGVKEGFYLEISQGLLNFLEKEKKFLKNKI